LHTTSRITGKNLGEAATLEVAQTLSEQNPDASVWLINHDSDLFPNSVGRPQLEASIARQHAGLGLVPKLETLNTASLQNPNLHFVKSVQFLDSISSLLGHNPDVASQWINNHTQATDDHTKNKPYGVLDKGIVRPQSTSWAAQVNASIEAGTNSRRHG
jgi:hypothetical protein